MEKRYYQEEIETMSYEDMKKLQSERLVKQVKHVWDNVPYYRKLMEENGALKAMMTGSGPTVFGLFDDEKTLSEAALKLEQSGLAKDVAVCECLSGLELTDTAW